MKRALKSFLTFSLVVLAACAQTEGTNGVGTGGSNGTGTGGNSGSGTGGPATAPAVTEPAPGDRARGQRHRRIHSSGTGETHTGGTTGAGGASSTGGTAGGLGKGGSTGTGGSGTGGTATGGAGGAHVGTGGTAGTGSGTGGSGQGSLFTIMVQLASAVKSTAPTTVGIVTWSITASGITAAHIDFGLDTTYGMTAPVDLTAAMYRTLLLGMKPAKTYHFRITASDRHDHLHERRPDRHDGRQDQLHAAHELLRQERGVPAQGLLHHLVLAGDRLEGAVHLRHRR